MCCLSVNFKCWFVSDVKTNTYFWFSPLWKTLPEPVNSRFWHLYIKHHSVFMSNMHKQVIQTAVLFNSWQQPFIVVTCHNTYVANPPLFPPETGISFATFGIQERAALWKSLTDYLSLFNPLPPPTPIFLSLLHLPLLHFTEYILHGNVKTPSIWTSLERTLCLDSNSCFEMDVVPVE